MDLFKGGVFCTVLLPLRDGTGGGGDREVTGAVAGAGGGGGGGWGATRGSRAISILTWVPQACSTCTTWSLARPRVDVSPIRRMWSPVLSLPSWKWMRERRKLTSLKMRWMCLSIHLSILDPSIQKKSSSTPLCKL